MSIIKLTLHLNRLMGDRLTRINHFSMQPVTYTVWCTDYCILTPVSIFTQPFILLGSVWNGK